MLLLLSGSQSARVAAPSTKDDSASSDSARPATRIPFMTSSSSCSSCHKERLRIARRSEPSRVASSGL